MSLRAAFDSPERKLAHVRRLFATIADRYDLITRLLSFGLDQRWKARLVRTADVRSTDRALDLACGTADIAIAVAHRGAPAIGLDITVRMLELARVKAALAAPTPSSAVAPIRFVCGDMGALPFPDATFSVITTGYGLRNVPDLDGAIAEIVRVLAPGGRALSLDFNRPSSRLIRVAYLTYLTVVGSVLGWVLHADADTYRYIPESIKRYPGADVVTERFRAAGFGEARVVPLLGGLMSLHVAGARTDRPRASPTPNGCQASNREVGQ